MLGPLVDGRWLAAHLDEVVVAEVRWGDEGRERQLPGAVLVDLDRDLSGAPGATGGRHPLPSSEDFARRMGALGIGDDDLVVAYDGRGGSIAARLWWMLHVTGHQAAVLDGGLAAWPGALEHEHEHDHERAPRPPSTFTPRQWPSDALADADAVERLRHRPDALLLDARAPERFRGDDEPFDARAGHIPGAVSAPWAANVDAATGRFLDADSLHYRYDDLGASAAREVVVYCGSGVTACHDLLALELAGLGPARLFVGSWSAWSADPSRPAATGAH